MTQQSQERFDAKLPSQQKQLFQRAADIGGYRSLTDFIFSSAQEKAEHLIERERKFLASAHDREIFFQAILNPPEPNPKLQKAAENYKKDFGQ